MTVQVVTVPWPTFRGASREIQDTITEQHECANQVERNVKVATQLSKLNRAKAKHARLHAKWSKSGQEDDRIALIKATERMRDIERSAR